MNTNSTVLLLHDVLGDDGVWAESGFTGADADLYKFTRSELDGILDAIRGGTPLQNRSDTGHPGGVGPRVWLTFDDGGSGARHAAELLERRGWIGHFFIPTSFIGKPGFLGASEIRDLHQRGHIIGSHSHSHPQRISALPPSRLDEEWRRSVEELQGVLGSEVTCGSIPGGFYSLNVVKASGRAGIQHLFTSEPRRSTWLVNGVTVHGRFSVQRSTTMAHVAGLASGNPRVLAAQLVLWNIKKIVKVVGGDTWLHVRRVLLARSGHRSFR